MTEASLLAQIRATLGTAIGPSLTLGSNGSDLFEGYVFSLIVEAARIEGGQVDFLDVFGARPATFVFRTSPGYIYSQAHPYGYALIVFAGRPPLEVHVGIRVVGKSSVAHECDVAIIEQAEAETCRQRRVLPRSRKVLSPVECKYYATRLKLSLAREFIGLSSDLNPRGSLFVTNTSSTLVERLLINQNRFWEHNVVPSNAKEVERLRNKFQDIFKGYKAR
jgi:hypothetical protein